jgi:hypothetical protein
MVNISRRKLLIVGLASGGLLAGVLNPVDAVSATARTTVLAYHDLWRKLWEDHITWTRVVILAILDGLPGTSAYVDRLLKNPGDMADALRPYYGAAADTVGDLIYEHLTIAAEILTDAKNGIDFTDAVNRWYANAAAIAAQMNQMNPRFWPLAETTDMWDEHLDATIEEVQAHLSGNYAAEVVAYDKVHDLALVMADFFSNGVIQQFRGAFIGKLI